MKAIKHEHLRGRIAVAVVDPAARNRSGAHLICDMHILLHKCCLLHILCVLAQMAFFALQGEIH